MADETTKDVRYVGADDLTIPDLPGVEVGPGAVLEGVAQDLATRLIARGDFRDASEPWEPAATEQTSTKPSESAIDLSKKPPGGATTGDAGKKG